MNQEAAHTCIDFVSDKTETDSNSDCTKMSRKDRIRKNVTIRKTKTPAFSEPQPTAVSTKVMTK